MKTEQSNFERIIETISPSWALRRVLNRSKLRMFYEAGVSNRARRNPPSMKASESSSQHNDRLYMIRSARAQSEDNGFVKGILLKLATYTLGSIAYQAQTGDDEVNDQYEEYFHDWCNVCDLTGRHTFGEVSQLVLISTLRDGDIGAEWVKRPGFFPALNMIEGDRIGGAYTYNPADNVFGGIYIDAYGKPTYYEVWRRDKESSYSDPRKVPAEAFIHVFDPMRVDQYRGITAFHACLNTLQDIHEILENEKMAVKWASAQGGVIESETGEDVSGYYYDASGTDTTGNTMRTKSVEAGALNYINPGESFKAFEYNRPSPAFQGLLDMLYREVAMALNMPFGFVYDLSKLGGPTARMDSAQAQRGIARLQSVMTNKWLNPVKNRVLADGIKEGKIPPTAKWMMGRWQFPAHPTIDVGRESKANLDENRQGMKTMAEICGENGKDWQEVIAQLAREAKMRKDIAAEVGVDPNEIRLLTPNMQAPAQGATSPSGEKGETPEKEDPEDDSD